MNASYAYRMIPSTGRTFEPAPLIGLLLASRVVRFPALHYTPPRVAVRVVTIPLKMRHFWEHPRSVCAKVHLHDDAISDLIGN